MPCPVPWRAFRVLLFALVSTACSERSRSSGAPHTTVSEAALARRLELDQQVLRRLAEAGSDLSQPHVIEHHFVCSTAILAEPVRTLGASMGFQPSAIVEQRHRGNAYVSFDLVRRSVPTLAEITQQTRAMLEIATKYGLEYDGWGCKLVE